MVLDKIIIHLKNILFFKAVIYVFTIVGLIILTPIVSDELKRATTKMHFAKSFLNQANVKLSSLSKFEDKLEETNKKYLALKNGEVQDPCIEHTNIMNQLNNLLKNKDNIEDLTVKINSLANRSEMEDFQKDVYGMNDILEIKHYTGLISFTTNSSKAFSDISTQIYKILPDTAIISAVTLQEIQTLSPNLIDKLSVKKKLMRFDAKIEFLLREIEYSS